MSFTITFQTAYALERFNRFLISAYEEEGSPRVFAKAIDHDKYTLSGEVNSDANARKVFKLLVEVNEPFTFAVA